MKVCAACECHVGEYSRIPIIMDTTGNPNFVPYSSGASSVFLTGMVLCNWAVAAFSELSFAVHWQGRLSRG